MIEVGEVQIYLGRKGMLVSWLDKEAHITGSIVRNFGCLNEGIAGQTVKGTLGLIDFEVLGYNRETDMFHLRRLS